MSDGVGAVVDVIAATAPEVRDGLADRRAYAEGENPSGERQLAADIYADELLCERLLDVDAVGSYASEERDAVIEDSGGDGRLHVACDPLDGSSNLRSNNAMGTLFGVYEAQPPAPGSALVAAGFVLFGPITTMVVARDGRVREWVLDGEGGDRRLLDEDLALPAEPTVYGFGGRVSEWTDAFAAYADRVAGDLKLRYGGAMLGDVTQVLTYGGIFGYPGLRDRPAGKLRLLFEAHPIAHVVEAAGGASSNGERSLLELAPERLHERTPLFVGDPGYVDDLEAALA